MDEDNLVSDLLRVYLAQTDSALKISEIISKHGNEEGISPDSFLTGVFLGEISNTVSTFLGRSPNLSAPI